MEFKFGTMSIFELGRLISSKLRDDGVAEQSELIIYLNKEEFRMVDEDLFFRNRQNTSDKFIPSEGEININFGSVKMIIKEIEENESN